jgi:hypothetical protein
MAETRRSRKLARLRSLVRAARVMLDDARRGLIQPHPPREAHTRCAAFGRLADHGRMRGSDHKRAVGAEDRLGANEPKNQGKNVARVSDGFFPLHNYIGDAKAFSGIYFFGAALRRAGGKARASPVGTSFSILPGQRHLRKVERISCGSGGKFARTT